MEIGLLSSDVSDPQAATHPPDAMSESAPDDRWYQNGLQFTCTRCGNCCTGEPGSVRVTDNEIEGLASLLEMDRDEFRAVYTRALRGGEVSLVEKRNNDCVFWDRNAGCSVYAARPRQCRAWPFWQAVVHSPDTWKEEARGCPGMNQGRLHAAERITSIAESDGTSSDS